MSINPRGRMAAAALAALLVASACGGGDDDVTVATTTSTTTTTTTTTTIPAGPFLPLTGLPVDEDAAVLEQPAIVVKISNNDTVDGALIGIEEADIVIEERIEARFTRFAAVFHSTLPELVGPIRSGRTSDLDLLSNLGVPILVFSGANPSVTGQLNGLEDDGLVKLVVDNGSGVDLFRDSDFRRPDNLFANLVDIHEKYGAEAGIATPLFEHRQADSDERVAGLRGEGVTVTGSNIVSFVWDEELGYVRVQDGEVHATREDTPIAVDNVVVLEASYEPSTFAPGSVDAQTVGTGPVTVMIGGKQWSGMWVRETRDDPYTFLDASGDPLLLDPGTTWLTLVPEDTYEFSVDPEIAALVLDAEG